MSEANWRSSWRHRVTGPDDAVAFVSALGFCTWLPTPGLDFPNLAEALGDPAALRATAAGPDPPGARPAIDAFGVLSQTWFWKDDLHVERRLYYTRLVRGQPTFVAPEWLPEFIAALAGAGHEVERDPERLYLDGRLTREARTIYDYLADYPAQPTRKLRRGAGLRGGDQTTATERALTELQRRFLVCKVDITGRTRGTYSYVWDLAERFWPEAFEQAQGADVEASRSRIRARLRAFGIEPSPALEAKLFLWRP